MTAIGRVHDPRPNGPIQGPRQVAIPPQRFGETRTAHLRLRQADPDQRVRLDPHGDRVDPGWRVHRCHAEVRVMSWLSGPCVPDEVPPAMVVVVTREESSDGQPGRLVWSDTGSGPGREVRAPDSESHQAR
jgi:hypothetical protein